MKQLSLTILALLLLSGCSEEETPEKAPEGMVLVEAVFKVLKEEKKEVPFIDSSSADIVEVDAVGVRFLEPKEFEGIEYSIHRLPSDPESVIFSDAVGKSFRCTVVKRALMNRQREFNSGALTNIEPIGSN